jgi:hypothetical protein
MSQTREKAARITRAASLFACTGNQLPLLPPPPNRTPTLIGM